MHIRINIPAWGVAELARGAAALARRGYVAALARELQVFAPEGWRPHLLASARYGLTLAVRALGAGRVAVPGYVCPAVLTGLRAAGAEAVAVDTAPDSFRFDVAALARVVNEGHADAVLAANTYGLDQDFPFLNSLGVPVIEDAAYQAGYESSFKLKAQSSKCGFRGEAGVWSFNFKALTGVGGGVLWMAEGGGRMADEQSENANRASQIPLFANYAVRALFREHLPQALGGAVPPSDTSETEARAVLQEMRTGPMSELSAALALTQWRRRAKLQAQQQANSGALERAVAECDALNTVADTAGQTKVHLFPLLVHHGPAEVMRVRRALYESGVQTETPYPLLLGGPAELPNAHALAARLVLVPCHASLGERQIDRITLALARTSAAA